MTQSRPLLADVRAALNTDDLACAEQLLAQYRSAADDTLRFDRNYLQLANELAIKVRRANGAARA